MSRRRARTAAFVAAAVAAIVLVLAPAALAGAGGGSSGYGGGGGGKGAGLYILFHILIRIAIFGHGLGVLILIGIAVLAIFYFNVLAPRVSGFQDAGRAARRRTARRERRVELAAAEAAEYDPAFAPDQVKPAAARLFTAIQAAWDAGDRARLRRLVGKDLTEEWDRRLDDFQARGWRNRVTPIEEPRIEYVGLTHRGDKDDRVVVRVECKLKDYVEDSHGNHIRRDGRVSDTTRVREFWTLARRDGRWMLESIEHGAEGTHALEEKIVATPWSDETALRDEALLEGAAATAVPEGTSIAEVADLQFEGDARAAALDLSLADGRFAPDVLEVAARRAVAAWAQAVDGDDHALNAVADQQAVRDLLHPGDPTLHTRLVVRGPRIEQIRIVQLDAGAEPPTMTIDVRIEGRRYIEDRATTAVLEGSRSRARSFAQRFTLALTDDARSPWRIATAAPVSA